MSETIPRGIQLVKWKNKDKTTRIRYRVRISKKDKITQITKKENKLFDNLQEAKEFLLLNKTNRGREIVYSLTEKEEKERQAYKEFISEPPLKIYIDQYITRYVKKKFNEGKNEEKKELTHLQKKNIYNIENFYKTIKNTEIKYIDPEFKKLKGMLAMHFQTTKTKKFGDFKISEITVIEINNYIIERLKTVKKQSVKRELTYMSRFFQKLSHIDNQFLDFKNPIENYDKDLLANTIVKREFRFTRQDQKTLFVEMKKHKNPEFKHIIMLSLLTAMRRSEIVFLTWGQIKQNYIQLIHTKSGRPRKVFLTKNAQKYIHYQMQRKADNERVFTYKNTDGFNGSWMHFIHRVGLSHCRFHDFRREAISRMVERMGAENSIFITEFLGIANVKKFKENHLDDEIEIKTEKGLLSSIGHADPENTKGYTNLFAKE